MNEKIFLGVLGVIAFIALVLAITGATFGSTVNDGVKNADVVQDAGYQLVNTGDARVDDASIALQPQVWEDGKLIVRYSINTHGITLSNYDLKEQVYLETVDGPIYPESAGTLSGHHNSGELVFMVDGPMDSFTIKVVGIPKLEERVYTWG